MTQYSIMDRIGVAIFIIALLVMVSGAGASCVAHWSFNDTGGLLNDCDVLYNLTNFGATSGASGMYAEAYDFDGVDDYAEESDDIDLLDNFTISGWVYMHTNNTKNAIVCESSNMANTAIEYCLYWNIDVSRFTIAVSNATNFDMLHSTTNANTNTWYHVLARLDGTNLSIWINNTLENSAVFTGVRSDQDTGAVVGKAGDTALWKMDGLIDEVWLFNRSLEETEINSLFTNNNITITLTPVYEVLSDVYTSPVFETTTTDYSFSIWTNTTNITTATASLWWNGTNYTPTSNTTSTTGTNKTYEWEYASLGIPLVENNATNISLYWDYSLTWDNTTTTHHNHTTNTQTINHGIYWGTYTPTPQAIEGDTIQFTATPTTASGVNTTAIAGITAIFNNTNYSLTETAGVWSTNTTAPAGTQNYTTNATITATWDGRTYYRTSANETISIYTPSLSSTCATGTPTLNFTFHNETAPNATSLSNMGATFEYWGTPDHTGIKYTTTANITNSANLTLCLYPSWTTIYVNSFQIYEETTGTSAVRNYFLTNATLTNTTNTINLFNIPTTESDMLTITINENLIKQPETFVIMERYYPSEDLYRAVEIGKTDGDGKTFLYPVPNDVYYRFLVIKDYEVVYSGEPRKVGVNEIIIDIGEGLKLEYFEYKDSVSVACAKTGNIIGCSIVNPTGLSVGAQFLVKEIGVYRDQEICFETISHVSTTTLTCNITNATGLIQADLMFIAPESLIDAWSETFNSGHTNIFGGLGLLISILLIIGTTLLLAYSPGLALVGAILGLVISAILGIVALSFTHVILIIVSAGFLIMKVRT